MIKIKFISALAFVFMLAVVLAAIPGSRALAQPDPPKVVSVPASALNPSVPHDTWSGLQITLKATAHDADGDVAALDAAQGLQRLAAFLDGRLDAPRRHQHLIAGVGGADPVGGALGQRQAGGLLQEAHLLGDGRRRDVERGGGAGDRAGAIYGGEGAQLLQGQAAQIGF